MAVPFFYEPGITNAPGHLTLSEESSKHCIQVLRMKVGEELQLTNGKGLSFIASIISEDKKRTVVLPGESIITSRPAKKISIAISILKNVTRFEWFLEKATEIGISEIQPFISKRTEHTRFRSDRMHGILVSAMLQSQQTWLPILHEPVSFEEIISQPPLAQQLIAHCEEGRKNFINELPSSTETRMLIGPEGDFTADEINIALQKNYLPVSLGETRLRAETAGIVAAALLMNK